MGQSLKVAVIGAGMAGLVTARELQREGHNVTVFEKSDRLGGTWVYDPRVESDLLGLETNRDIIHSSMYQSLRVNLPRQLMSFSDYSFSVREDGDRRSFSGHEEVLRYLEDFARDFGLLGLIRFEHEVTRIEQVGGDWVVEWKIPGSEAEDVFEAVVVCNGKDTEPRIADFPGRDTWPGMQMHSHNFRTPNSFQNKIVVIIGNGPSALDIMAEIAPVATEVHQALRAENSQFKMLANSHNTWQHSMIEFAREDGQVAFHDGSFVYADAIIHCTGYKYHFSFLRTKGKVSAEDRVGPLYKQVFPPSLAPKLSFVGIPQANSQTVPSTLCEIQSEWVAKVLSGKVFLPTEDEMESSVEQFYEQMEKSGKPKQHTHSLAMDKCQYENWILAQLGKPPMEKWREDMFVNFLEIGSSYGNDYKDTWDFDEWMLINGHKKRPSFS